MTKSNQAELQKRFGAFLWALGSMAAAAGADFVLQNLTLLDLPDLLTVGLGLVLAQVTKHFSKAK